MAQRTRALPSIPENTRTCWSTMYFSSGSGNARLSQPSRSFELEELQHWADSYKLQPVLSRTIVSRIYVNHEKRGCRPLYRSHIDIAAELDRPVLPELIRAQEHLRHARQAFLLQLTKRLSLRFLGNSD